MPAHFRSFLVFKAQLRYCVVVGSQFEPMQARHSHVKNFRIQIRLRWDIRMCKKLRCVIDNAESKWSKQQQNLWTWALLKLPESSDNWLAALRFKPLLYLPVLYWLLIWLCVFYYNTEVDRVPFFRRKDDRNRWYCREDRWADRRQGEALQVQVSISPLIWFTCWYFMSRYLFQFWTSVHR